MSLICQNIGILTTATVRTILTVFVTTSLQQMAGRPTTSTIFVANPTCRTAGSGNSSTVVCATSTQASVTVITPAASQVQVSVTVTNQYLSTQSNTLFGSLCRTAPGGSQPTPDGYTDTTYTTEYFTVTGSEPLTTPPSSHTSTATGSSRTSLSRNTVYGGDPTADGASGTELPDPGHSSSSTVPVGAIVGGVLGGLVAVALLGFLVYYLLVKKSLSAKGYKAPGEEFPYHDGEQSDVFSSEQTGYYAQGSDGQGYSSVPQNQGFGGQQQHLQSGPTQAQGSYPMQYADMGSQGAPHVQPQDVAGGNMYPEPQGPQYLSQTEMGQMPFNTGSGATFPVAAAAAGAALPVVVAASISNRYSSSSSPPPGSAGQYSPESHISTIPLINNGSPYQRQQQISHTSVSPVPYRGYAEPSN